jgi:hypothetical protein
MNENGYCPNCGVDLDGGSIWEHFYKETRSEAKATHIAAQYGATKEKGQWGRQVGIYDLDADRTTQWECPDCKHIWGRK